MVIRPEPITSISSFLMMMATFWLRPTPKATGLKVTIWARQPMRPLSTKWVSIKMDEIKSSPLVSSS